MDEQTVPPTDVGLNEQLGLLLRETIDSMQAGRDAMRKLGEADPDVWQFSTGPVGVALYRAVTAEQKRWADAVADMARVAADNNDLRVYELLRGLNDAMHRA